MYRVQFICTTQCSHMYNCGNKSVLGTVLVASFPGSPSFRAIIPRMTFDPPSAFPSGGSKVIHGIIPRKEGEPGNEATVLACCA